MNRRDFLKSASAVGMASVAGCRAVDAVCCANGSGAGINLCLQWHAIPVSDDFNAKLDYLEANGYAAVEIPTGRKGEWILEKGEAFGKAMQGRRLFCATACGPSRFDYADPKMNDAEVAKFMPVLEILGGLKSVGLILCPARSKPEVGLKELREDFVANTGKRDGETVVQVYVRDTQSQWETPNAHLAGFARVAVKAGEEKQIAVKLDKNAFTVVNGEGERIADGKVFDVYCGVSQPDETSCELMGQKPLKATISFE